MSLLSGESFIKGKDFSSVAGFSMLVYRQTNITHLLSCTRESAFPVPPFPVKMQNMYIRPGYRLRPPDYIMKH